MLCRVYIHERRNGRGSLAWRGGVEGVQKAGTEQRDGNMVGFAVYEIEAQLINHLDDFVWLSCATKGYGVGIDGERPRILQDLHLQPLHHCLAASSGGWGYSSGNINITLSRARKNQVAEFQVCLLLYVSTRKSINLYPFSRKVQNHQPSVILLPDP